MLFPSYCTLKAHRILRSFQTHVERGVVFEKETINVLKPLGFHLRPTKFSHDNGIDFRGIWRLPSSTHNSSHQHTDIRVVGQCKHERKKCGTKVLREIEGVAARQKHETGLSTIAMVCCSAGFSPFALRLWMNSKQPMIIIRILHESNNLLPYDDTKFIANYSNVEKCSTYNKACKFSESVIDSLLPNRAALTLLPLLQIGTVFEAESTNCSKSSTSDLPIRRTSLLYNGIEIGLW